jgi:cysteine desulfurase/selenocysteine lyase
MLTPAHKLVALAHVSNVLGSVLDVERAVALAHGVGAKILIDGCQAVPRLPVDVAALGVDFYAFPRISSMAPPASARSGRGRKSRRHAPWQGGGSMIDRVTFEKTTWAPRPPVRGGHPAIVEAIGFAAAVDYVRASAWTAIHAHEAGWSKPCAARSRR